MHRRHPLHPAPAPAPVPVPRRKGAAAAAASQEWLVVPPAGEPRAGEFGRHRIMEMTGLPARDLRVLDPLLSYPSTILGRDRAIVLNLEHVKAIVTAAEVLVRDPSNPRLQPFLLELHARLALPDASIANLATDGGDETEQAGQGNVPMSALGTPGCAKNQPFEFKVLEVCLEHTCKCMESETLALEKEAYPALDELATRVSTRNLEHVRQIKSRLVELLARVQKVRDDIERLLDDDADMSELYLTRKFAFQGANESPGRVESNKHASADHDDKEEEDHGDETESSGDESSAHVKPDIQELEMLLEAYFVQVDGTLNKLCHLNDYVDDTEKYIEMMLDEQQNRLLQTGVMLTTATVVVTAGIVVVSLFGMNIHIDLMKDPETPEMASIKNMKFWETTWGTVAGCAAIYFLLIYAGKKSKYLK
ncbi:magnesium transporter MRS2-E [Lolium perenne]|uniref:magnesium transporter MRS2-E n=1 Tax=Lolium perenne TaxID=4522 RepID=UPI0021EB2FD5|nr:magnesium transporter MRS2-E-like [Lolium perenne]